MLALLAGIEGSTPTGGTCSNDFFRSNRPGYPHSVCSELENSGIRVAVGNCSVTERRRWLPPYQTGKTVHVHAKHYKHNEDGRTAPGVCGNGSVPLSHSGNVVTRIGIHTHTHTHTLTLMTPFLTADTDSRSCHTRPRGYKTFFVLNSIEHEILNAHKYKKKNIKKFGFFRFR